jgi:hypothetical protein
MTARRAVPLLPLFLVSLAAVGFEIALTRYFAIASWSEYGYWVISITMVGFAASGVVLSLFKDFFFARAAALLRYTPVLLLLAAATGYYVTTIVSFNPLEFQNPGAWGDQLANIGKYYLALFPFYFLTGLYIGLYFLSLEGEIPKVYAADLAGAGVGAIAVLVAMYVVPPFLLLAALLPLLLLAVLPFVRQAPRKTLLVGAALVAFGAAEAIVFANRADFNEYKAIYPPLHVQDGKRLADITSPRGYYTILDNFTERLDTDFSNNFQALGAKGPPRTLGLYSDGNRIASLPSSSSFDPGYVKGMLDALPYALRPQARALLIGTRGGFRIAEAQVMGAATIHALEPTNVLFEIVAAGPYAQGTGLRFSQEAPWNLRGTERYDVIDLASDFLGQAETNKFAFTVEAVQGFLGLLSERGVLSIPVSIREFTVYAAKMVETTRRALIARGIKNPEAHLIVYRSAWNVRILASPAPFSAADIIHLKQFAGARSFDTSYFPGIDPKKLSIWNDLPPISLESDTMVISETAQDALMDQTLALLGPGNIEFLETNFFDLEPPTLDRPSFYSILRLEKLPQILKKIALIPREEIGYLVNLAVLVQAVVFAALVLGLPLLRYRKTRPAASTVAKSILYFASLGLGFLFFEILFIEKMAYFLNDRTYAFAVVLSAMLIFSGFGSFFCSRFLDNPARGVRFAVAIVAAWSLLAALGLDALMQTLLGAPFAVKLAVAAMVAAPLAFGLGMPFPLGLYLFRGEHDHFLPWAWSLNGAFSVVATPAANLLAVSFGYTILLVLGLALYIMTVFTYPAARGRASLS